MTAEGRTVQTPARGLIRLFWLLHRAAYRLTGGRFGLQRPAAGQRFGMMRLATIGRRSGKARVAIVGYYEDGPNLVTVAMNGWGRTDPAWWLNLQATPDAVVQLVDGPRNVRARVATGAERDRLWARFDDFPGWGDDLDALAARRPAESAVVVFEPRSTSAGSSAPSSAAPEGTELHPAGRSSNMLPVTSAAGGRRRLRPRHLWILPGLAITFYASGQADHLGTGIVPLLVFGIVPDLPRLLGIGHRHAPGQMPMRAVPAFNALHRPVLPAVMLALGAWGVLPQPFFVGALAWLGHLVIGLGVGDRTRTRDGFLRPLWPIGGARAPQTREHPGGQGPTAVETPA